MMYHDYTRVSVEVSFTYLLNFRGASYSIVLCVCVHVYQPVPLRKNKSYEPTSTATERNVDKRKKPIVERTNFSEGQKAKRKYLHKRFFESMEKRLQNKFASTQYSLLYFKFIFTYGRWYE